MPHINRIRVNNVRYNDGKQFYDDFKMDFACSNTLYDMVNGGGKSLLMLLLLQNLIPNCQLDDKQPVEKLFRGKEGSTVIHSLIEWRLDDDDRSGYKYMTTGFCAKKKSDMAENNEIVKTTEDIDYFNYCIFYNFYNEYDINNLPLQDKNQRITYSGLKKLLRDISRENAQLAVETFDQKGRYQTFISQHGLYESEWELIRGINRTEGHVRAYFEQNYRTSRKVVEDLLIENIIQRAFIAKTNRANDEEDLARTLLSIKDKIVELSKKKSEIYKYDRQTEIVNDFADKAGRLKDVYEKKDEAEINLVKTYNTFKNMIGTKYDEQDLADEKLRNVNAECLEVEKNIETIKIQKKEYKLSNIKEELNLLEDKLKDINSQYLSLEEEIKLKEAKNYFIDYLKSKDEYDKTNETLHGIFKANESLITELNLLSYNRKIRDDDKLKNLNEKLIAASEKIEALKSQIESASSSERKLDNEMAVKKDNIISTQKKISLLKDKISSLRSRVNILLLSELDSEIEKNKNSRDKMDRDLKNNISLANSLNDDLTGFKIEKTGNEGKLGLINEKIAGIENTIGKYDDDSKKAETLFKVYGAESDIELKDSLENRYKNLIGEISGREAELERLQDYYGQLMQDKQLPATGEVKKVREYINDHYNGDGILGTEYLQDLLSGQKEEILNRIPFLPYSVIVTYSFEKLLKDEKFKDCDFGNYIIPIVNLDAVRGKSDLNIKDLTYALKDKEKFINEEKIKQEKIRIEKEIEESKNSIYLLKDNEAVLKSDLSFINEFLLNYHDKIEGLRKKYEDLENEKGSIQNKIAQINKKIDSSQGQIKNIASENGRLEKAIASLDEDLKVYAELKDYFDELNCEDKNLLNLNEEFKGLNLNHSSVKGILEGLKTQEADDIEIRNSISRNIDSIKKEWDEVYKIYYKDGQYAVLDITDDDLQSRYKGRKNALDFKNANVKNYEELAKTYSKNMDRNKREVEDRGFNVDELYRLRENNEIIETDENALKGLKGRLKGLKDELKKLENKVNEKRSTGDTLKGDIGSARERYEEVFGEYIPMEIESFAYDRFEEENKLRKEKLQQSIKDAQAQQQKIVKEIQHLSGIIQNVELVLASSKIASDRTKDVMDVTDNIESYFNDLQSGYNEICRKESVSRSIFAKSKESNINALKEIDALELAEDFNKNINIPEGTEKCTSLISSLNNINDLISVQKSKVENDIKDMERIKENFENQCLQRCRDVKTELDRLPRLSKLYLHNEQIQMVDLKIPYIKEDQQRAFMSQYIDDIIGKVDSIDDSQEKIKYIKNQLTLKRIFSVIVTDMNSVSLKLYKREQIAQQSKSLKYEEAVGSTGQSQGIYIQFLIAVINYIKNINSFNADNKKLRKVIFLDNPFGAAKDIYIWEPIFEFLKTNNVQLIVPARGVAPVITCRFDVNYLLGQKLIGGRQQTVVLEVRSQVSPQEVEFKKVEQEQIRFDSLFDM